jgi:hypothetical protein
MKARLKEQEIADVAKKRRNFSSKTPFPELRWDKRRFHCNLV